MGKFVADVEICWFRTSPGVQRISWKSCEGTYVGRPSPESMESLRQLYAVERTIKPLKFGPALKPTEVQWSDNEFVTFLFSKQDFKLQTAVTFCSDNILSWFFFQTKGLSLKIRFPGSFSLWDFLSTEKSRKNGGGIVFALYHTPLRLNSGILFST